MFRVIILLCLSSLWMQSTFARPTINPSTNTSSILSSNAKLAVAERFNRQGLYLYALDSLDMIIAKGLGDEDVYAYRGTILTMRGQYLDAIHDFERGLGADRLNGRDGESYVYAKFVGGDCGTDSLESIRHFGVLPAAANIRLLSTEVEIHRYCNRMLDAEHAQELMELQFPRAVKTHLAAADLALDIGDVDQAWRRLFNAQLFYQYIGVRDIAARIAMIEGRYEDAFQLMKYIQSQRVPDRSMILNGLALVLAGESSFWLHKLDQPRWQHTDNLYLLYLRLWAMHETSNPEYTSELEWFQLLCDDACTNIVRSNLEREIQQPLRFQL